MLLLCAAASAGTIYVDDNAPGDPGPGDPAVSDLLEDGSADHPFDAIQQGIDAAVAGDTVEVADGIYTGTGNKDLDFGGKAITVRSASGDPATCIIDCQGSGRGFYFHSGETDASVVDGFAVRNGSVDYDTPGGPRGGGVYCYSSSPTLTNCAISGNSASSGGGGVRCDQHSSPVLTNCAISGNSASSGGGVDCDQYSSPVLTNCTISSNSAVSGSGANCGYYCSPTFDNCTISANRAVSNGAGVVCSYLSSPTLINCMITGNRSTSTNPASAGGGVYCSQSTALLINCTIAGNAAVRGGGVSTSSSGATLINCTIRGNTAVRGGGLYCSGSSAPSLTNCVLWNDTAPEVYTSTATPTIMFCDVQGGYAGTGNIDSDPGFADGADSHLAPGSPCIDAGTNDPIGGLPAYDADGTPRALDGNGDGQAVADMGAYEFDASAPTIAVSSTRVEFFIPEGTADPWTETLSIRNAGGGTLQWAVDWDASWLQADPPQGESAGEARVVTLEIDASDLPHGTYETIVTVSDPEAVNNPRRVEVTLHVNNTLPVPGAYSTLQAAIDAAVPGDEVLVADGIYTGTGNRDLDFHGKAITLRSASGNPGLCVIDCEHSGRGFYFHSGETAAAVVAGLTVRNGWATYRGPGGANGAGVYCDDASPTLQNCVIKDSIVSGLYCGCLASPTLTNCAISGSPGAGVSCACAHPVLTNCTISANGFGVDSWDSGAELTNCVVWGNTWSGIDGSWSGGPAIVPFVAYSDVQGGYAGTGNIDLDPGFAFADDYHLMPNSPCADAGTNSPTGGLPPQDADANARPLDGNGDGQAVADMGAYEFDASLPAIALSPLRMEFHAAEGQAAPDTHALSIRNGGGGVTLHWALDCQASWLHADALEGESAGEVHLVQCSADASALLHGVYTTVLTISSAQASNAPRLVDVTLYVNKSLRVPTVYPTIQSAIDAAVPGDEVLLADGVYTGAGNKDLDFRGKAITVRSDAGDPAVCVIDCQNSGRGFYFHSGETRSAVLGGVTIRNGKATSATVGSYYGGGVFCDYRSGPTLICCTITGNSATSSGGGMYCYASSPALIGCTISGNTTATGGGLYSISGGPMMINCSIIANRSTSSSGARGGGLYCYGGAPALINCTISANSASSSIAPNDHGGGIYCDFTSPWLVNCTINGNTADNGGALYCYSLAYPRLYNCILWGDTPQEMYLGSSTAIATYCDIQGGYVGTGNINADPLFVDPDGPDNDPSTWQDNDYRLRAGSPCIDAGNSAAVPADTFDLDGDGDLTEPLPLDLAGNPRFVDDPYTPDTGNPGDPPRPVVDMGAYELPYLRGDGNCDGGVDLDDVNPFVLALVDQARYEVRYPGCPWRSGDVNADGSVDFDDISPFVALLIEGE